MREWSVTPSRVRELKHGSEIEIIFKKVAPSRVRELKLSGIGDLIGGVACRTLTGA